MRGSISNIISREYLHEEEDVESYKEMPNSDIATSIYHNVLSFASGECTSTECINTIADETGIDSDAKKRIKSELEDVNGETPLNGMIHNELVRLVEKLTGLAIREPEDNSEHDQEWEEV